MEMGPKRSLTAIRISNRASQSSFCDCARRVYRRKSQVTKAKIREVKKSHFFIYREFRCYLKSLASLPIPAAAGIDGAAPLFYF
jgi:hypothetical protein